MEYLDSKDNIQQNDDTDNAENYIGRIRNDYHSLTKTQKKIANFIVNNEKFVLANTITSIANKIGTNPASITRFCQALRYKGFNELKFYIENNMLMLPENSDIVSKNDSLSVSIKKLTRFELDALNDTVGLIDEHEVSRAVNAICHAHKVYFYGEGGTGSSAQLGYYLFMQIGITSNCFQSEALMLMANTHLEKGDVIIGMSFSGRAQGVLEALTRIKEDNPGVTVIAVTAFPNSPITRFADIKLFYSCNIHDDLQYLHVARICEVSIIGILQTGVINMLASIRDTNMNSLKYAITSRRIK